MIVVLVHVRVKAACIAAFKEASIDNARHSIRESGVVRFDVIQREDDPARFILNEVYRDEAAAKAHKETEHYLRWRDAVADMMAEPRRGIRYINVFPDDADW